MLVDLYDVKASYLSTASCRVAGCGVLQGAVSALSCDTGHARPLSPDGVLYQIYYICVVRFSPEGTANGLTFPRCVGSREWRCSEIAGEGPVRLWARQANFAIVTSSPDWSSREYQVCVADLTCRRRVVKTRSV